MEDFFDNNVCSICKHKCKSNCKDCMLLETHNEDNGVFCYKCLNYEKMPLEKTGEWAIQGFFLERIVGGKEFGKIDVHYESKAIYEKELSKNSYCS